MHQNGLWCWFVLVTLISINHPRTHAGLVVAPSGGTVLFSGDVDYTADRIFKMDAWASFSGKFFGNNRIAYGDGIYVSEDGNINFANDKNFFPTNPPYVARISPLWDDYLFAQTPSMTIDNRVLTHQSPGFVGVTWENVRLSFETGLGTDFPTTNRTFQTLWFESNTQIRGFQFEQDDIAFGYDGQVIRQLGSGGVVHASFLGLQSGGVAGTNVVLPGLPADGLLYDGDSTKLTLGLNRDLGGDEFLLFRATGNSYTLTLQSFTAVPEPSSLLCLVIALSSIVVLNGRFRGLHVDGSWSFG